MSDLEERVEEGRRDRARVQLTNKVRRINAELSASAGVSDSSPAYLCESCAREIDFCKCEDDL